MTSVLGFDVWLQVLLVLVVLLVLLVLTQAGVAVPQAHESTRRVRVRTVQGSGGRGPLAKGNWRAHAAHQSPRGRHSCLGRWVIWSRGAVDLWETAGRPKRKKEGISLIRENKFLCNDMNRMGSLCCFDVVWLACRPYWHVSAIVLIAHVLFQDTGVDVGCIQSTGNIMAWGKRGEDQRVEMEGIWELATTIFQQFRTPPHGLW